MRAWTTALLLLLAATAADAAEYVGLWRLDEGSPGIAVDYPDNGFHGACVRLSNGEGTGELRLESQVNRHRFEKLSLQVSGQVNPLQVHVQLRVKNKTAWIASEPSYDAQPVQLKLDGYEVTIEAKEMTEEVADWELSLCGLELRNDRYAMRFTSDCAGFDVDERSDEVRVIVDEDWFSLGREMAGGMGIFGLAGLWQQEEATLTVASSFPAPLFFAALAVDDKPILQPATGEPASWDYPPGDPADYQLVVKAKAPTVGKLEWRASLGWAGTSAAPEPEGDLVAEPGPSDLAAETAGDDAVATEAEPGGGSGGCRAGPPAHAHEWALLFLFLLLLLRYHGRPRGEPH